MKGIEALGKFAPACKKLMASLSLGYIYKLTNYSAPGSIARVTLSGHNYRTLFLQSNHGSVWKALKALTESEVLAPICNCFTSTSIR